VTTDPRRPRLSRRALLGGGAAHDVFAGRGLGGHHHAYWRRLAPDQLRFVADALA
jgi:hypothetical protein